MQFIEYTPRLILKTESVDSAPRILEFYLRNREHFTPYEPQVSESFYTLNYQQRILEYEFNDLLKGNSFRYYLYLKSDPERIIGSVNLTQIVHAPFCKAAMGYKLDYEMQGCGYAAEASKKLMELAATKLKLHRIEARVLPHNERSIRVLERLHFQYEGIEYQSVKVNGCWQDLYRYSILLY